MTVASGSSGLASESKQAPEPSLLTPSTFTLGDALVRAGLPLQETMVIRHAYVKVHKDGFPGINADSTVDQILSYTSTQSRDTKVFELRVLPRALSDLVGRLVIQWASPRAWWVNGTTGQKYPVIEVADVEPEPFPGFDHLIVGFDRLQAVISDPRYAAWRTALSSVIGIYLITDLSDGRQYVGKADGNETLLRRWTAYAANGHGGNVELKKRERSNFQFSVLRVLDPSTAGADVNAVESHYKTALGTRTHGLNKN